MDSLVIFKFFKFGIVGFSGMLIDFGVTYVLKEYFKINRFIANAFGFLLAASSNYFLNRVWTFASKNPEIAMEYGSFVLVSVIGLGINTFFLYLFEKRLPFYYAKFFAIVMTTFWNFFANYLITFQLRF